MGLFLIGCQQIPNGTTATQLGNEVVQAQNGIIYSVSCLRANAAAIGAHSSAMNECKVEMALQAGSSRNATERCSNCSRNNQNYIVYYPPTYYSPSYSSGGSNQFCNYVFGNNWNSNCFGMFGYPQSSSYYYVPSCSQSCMCGNSFSSSCPSSCYSATPNGYGSGAIGNPSYYYGYSH